MAEPSWIGKKLSGRYEIESLLGAGGMSSVYKANDPNLRRPVAIKLIHPHLTSDPQFISRFEEEAVSVAQLRHPNIIQVHDFANDGDTYYMVLEFVPGETLEDRMKREVDNNRQMSLQKVIEAISSVCDALEFAHKRGMFHRDIKPANIMINVQGQAILMDFGIAKIVGGKQFTATGAIVGTALYMAPEIIQGEQADHRVDIYSLGITLFEALAGKRPFEAESAMTTLMMHVNDPVPDVRDINPAVPQALVDIVVKSLAKDKADRYQTAAEFALALRRVDLKADPVESVAPAGLAGTMIEDAPPVESLQMAGTLIEDTPGSITGATKASPPARRPSSAPTTSSAGKKGGGLPMKWIGLGGGGLLLVAALAYFAFGRTPTPEPIATATLVPTEVAIVIEPTAIIVPTETLVLEPTATLEPTEIPTATLPPGPQIRISTIALDGSTYVVEYETFEYTESLPGMHIHFYFNNFTQEQVGSGGGGSWKIYGGPNPFRGYTVSNLPSNATQMCAIVANSNHTVVLNTGNCIDLP